MKKLLLLLTLAPCIAFGQLTYVPDDNFENYLETNGMGDGIANNDYVLTANISSVTNLYVDYMNITDLTGIEDFTALTWLYCDNNQLTSLDVSNNTALTWLYCHDNQLTSLDVSNNTALGNLQCYNNQLTSLDLSNNTALYTLDCGDNQLTSLDVSHNTALANLHCYGNQLASLDVSNNTALGLLHCYNNQLTSLDVSNNTALTWLYCHDNQLTSLDVSNNIALTYFDCSGNQLSCLNIKNGNNQNIISFDAQNNPNLTCIDVDNPVWSAANWTNKDSQTAFWTDCGNPCSSGSSSGAIRKVLLEDFTGHTCGNSPRSAETAVNLQQLYGEQVVVIAAHIGFFAQTQSNPDSSYSYDFTTTVGNDIDAFFGINATGLPKGMINRTEVNGSALLPYAAWESAIQALFNLPPDIDINVTNTYDTTSRVVTSSVEIEFLNGLSGTYNVAVYLTEDSIINWQKDYDTNPQDIENYVHRHVLRGALNGTWGELVDPAPVVNTIYTKSNNLTLDNTWNENHCSIVAFVYETSSNEVVQAEEVHINPFGLITSIPDANFEQVLFNHSTKDKHLLYITDILGRTALPVPNTLLFYIYDDGSVEKRAQLER